MHPGEFGGENDVPPAQRPHRELVVLAEGPLEFEPRIEAADLVEHVFSERDMAGEKKAAAQVLHFPVPQTLARAFDLAFDAHHLVALRLEDLHKRRKPVVGDAEIVIDKDDPGAVGALESDVAGDRHSPVLFAAVVIDAVRKTEGAVFLRVDGRRAVVDNVHVGVFDRAELLGERREALREKVRAVVGGDDN